MINNQSTRKLLGICSLYLSLGIIIGAAILKFIHLSADPPYFFAGTGQDLLTDPYNVTSFARNKILFGAWDIFEYPRWIFFKYSLSSAAAYLSFLIGGVSRITANFSSTILSILGIGLFSLGMAKESKKSGLISLLLLITNMPLFVYGRFPFLENGLIFLSALLFYIFACYGTKTWGLFASGLLVALCALSGKIFGIVMIVPIVLVIMKSDKMARFRWVGIFLSAVFISMILLAFVFYGREIGTVLSYISDQTIGAYGIPKWISSPGTVFEQILSLGREFRLLSISPALLGLLAISLSVILLVPRDNLKIMMSNRLLVFNLAWFISGFLLLTVFNYQPLRYQLFLMPPISGIITILFSGQFEADFQGKIEAKRIIALLFLCWFFSAQSALLIIPDSSRLISPSNIAWLCLIPAVVLTFVLILFRDRYLKLVRIGRIVPMVLLTFYVLTQADWIYKWYSKPTYDLQRSGEDLAQILTPDATIIGPYAQALTIDNKIRSFVYMFGLPHKDPDLFRKFGCTHIAVDAANEDIARRDYPEVAGSLQLARYWIRDVTANVSAIIGEQIRTKYQPTDYEIAARFSSAHNQDSAYFHLQKFVKIFPDNKSALTLLANHYILSDSISKGLDVYAKMIAIYPDDYSLYFDLALLQYKIYLISDDNELLRKSTINFKIAADICPAIIEHITRAKKQAIQAAGKQISR